MSANRIRRTARRPLVAPLVATSLPILVLLGAPQVWAQRTIQQRIDADPAGAVKVTNVAGRIGVKSWNRSEVAVSGSIGDAVERVDVQRRGADVVVRVVLPKVSRGRYGSADLDVNVPAGSSIEVSGVSAAVDVSGASAAVQVRTVSGDVAIASPGAQRVDVRSVSGDIVLREVGGTVDAQSVSGDIRAELGPVRQLRVKSTSGDIVLRSRIERGSEVEAETTSGNLEIRIPTAGRPRVDAGSFSGDVTVCGVPDVGHRGGDTPGRRIEVAGDVGAARIRARSMSGDIVICDR